MMKVLFIVVLFFAKMQFVTAKELVKVTDIKVINQTDTITLENISANDNELTQSIEFTQLGDYITYELEIMNSSDIDYHISSFTNSMDDYISIKSPSIGSNSKRKKRNNTTIFAV